MKRTIGRFAVIILSVVAFAFQSPAPGLAQKKQPQSQLEDVAPGDSEMRASIERYTIDRASLQRSYPVAFSSARNARFKQLYSDWLTLVSKTDFDSLSLAGRVDYLLFRSHLQRELNQLEAQSKQFVEIEPLIPFAKTIVELEEARRRMDTLDSAKAAASLTEVRKQIEDKRKAMEIALRQASKSNDKSFESDGKADSLHIKKTEANRAVLVINGMRANLRNWFNFYNSYDPLFSWWLDEPYKTTDQALIAYAAFLSEKVAGAKYEPAMLAPTDNRAAGTGTGGGGQRQTDRPPATNARAGDSSDIVGDPIGRDSLISELEFEMIPYTPEELISLAEKEMAWCEAEMKKASREMGFGDDWHQALERVKTLFVEPGKQPELIRDLALEAIKYMDDHDLVTVPQLARDTWRMEMMTPERQLVNPFFTGGEIISVSYPTESMTFEQKMMSMRGNNIHFSRATVFHELIPGHHLQGYMTARYRPYRQIFSTPFWGEGWSLYWELLLWDMNFAKSPENRIGMLFWRMHRCARIMFSLGFHLGKMSPQECIDLLVNRVGHERENAIAEVRRSFNGTYPPLYQAAYLLGGLQIRALHRELVEAGKMTNREFHDAILKENRIPIEMVRAILTNQKLTRDFKTSWKFYGQTISSR